MTSISATPPTLALEGMAKSFGATRAVVRGDLTVHAGQAVALLGANGAGKSTLMNLLGGIFPADAGSILIEGVPVRFTGPRDASHHGIAFVQQELSIFPSMSVAENVFADAYPTRAGRLDQVQMIARSKELLDTLGADLDPAMPMDGLSTGECQMVEIARAMRRAPKVLIFDEPTSSLTGREKGRLHTVIKTLKAQGVAIIYITHFISEIFDVCERAVVMRNGETIADERTSQVSHGDLVRLMLGDVAAAGRLVENRTDFHHIALEVSDLALPGRVEHASFRVHAGEIVGLWGLLGSGRTELVRALLGLDGKPSGSIAIARDGVLRKVSPQELREVTAFVTEDRRREGVLLPFSVAQNTALPNLPSLSGAAGLVSGSKVRALARSIIAHLSIKVQGPGQRVGTLSGGNQQKVVFGKWLASNPQILVLDEPTRGLDLSAKADIMRLSVELASNGAAILLISSELEELMSISYRYLIVSERRIVAQLPGTANENDLIEALSATHERGKNTGRAA
jgi:ABC-type sugar transport system ATPase subunit